WLSILLLRVHQNALVARWLNAWQWLALPSTSSASGASETAWLRGWVAARQDYVMTCWDAVWYHIVHPSATFKVSTPTTNNNNTLSEKSRIESPESIVPDVDSTLATTSPPIIEVRLPPRSTTSSLFEEAASAAVRNVEVEGDAGLNHFETEDASTASDCSPVCDSGYASSAEVDEPDVTVEDPETSAPLTFIDSPVIRKHVSSFSYFEVTSTSSSCETIPLPLIDEFATTTTMKTTTQPTSMASPSHLSYHGTYLAVPAKPCYESLVHAKRALRCTIVGWWGEEPDSEDEHEDEGEADAEDEAGEDMCVEDIVYWLEDDEEELPDLPNDW
ncbi:hypothetical protein FRC01_009044, partial [Tulasnella sp. 417]